MEILSPSPPTTLLLLLGASAWPFSPDFQSSEAFAHAAQRIKTYFLHPGPFGLPPENLLDLFDANPSPDELDVEMRQFLEQRLAAMKASGRAARDILVYFVGHGGFVGRDADFYLAIRRTRMDNPRASGVQIHSLADTLMEKARHLRRIIILDCCFAAAAFSAFQSEPAQVALEKTRDAFAVKEKGTGFPGKGTVLLCSSNHTSPSLLLPDGSSTMFTKALVDTLMQGATPQHEYLSLREVAGLAAQALMGIRNAPRPIVLSPDQSEGDIADIPFFPNPRAEEERSLLERRRLGPYRLLRLLGSGGMGEVYLAEDARIGQQVAIKVIRAEGVAHPESESAKKAARLFEREAKAIARLDHPNILPLFAYGEETLGEQLLTYLVMPYRKEGTLASWLRQRGRAAPLSPAEVAPLLQQAADALQHAHTQDVIHQDVKPTNFLIRLRDDHPDHPDLLLMDFGIAKLMSATGSLSQSIRGTPTYMAPEQWDGHPVAASDQYALAIMVYELLVGRPPFVGNLGQVMHQHYLTPPPAPSSLDAHLSPAIDAVLLRALAKQPDERFPSVTAFARAFHEAMQSEGELHATLAISRAEAEDGTTRTLPLPGGRQASVTVPAGVSDGTTLRLEGQGMPYYTGGPAGPLVLTIAISAEASQEPLPLLEPAVAAPSPAQIPPSIARMPRSSGSLRSPRLFQLSGWALVISGVVAIVQGSLNAFLFIVLPHVSITDLNNPWWRLDELLIVTLLVLSSLGLAGLQVKQSDRARQIGLIGIVMLFPGNLGLAVYYMLLFSPAIYPQIVYYGHYSALYNVSLLLSLVGTMLVGIAIVRAGIFPRWAAIVLILSQIARVLYFTPLAAVPGQASEVIVSAGVTTLVGVALAGCGYALLPRHKVLAV